MGRAGSAGGLVVVALMGESDPLLMNEGCRRVSPKSVPWVCVAPHCVCLRRKCCLGHTASEVGLDDERA